MLYEALSVKRHGESGRTAFAAITEYVHTS